MKRIIDFHTQLGDCFDSNKNIVFKKPVKLDSYPNPILAFAESKFQSPLDISSTEAKNELADAMHNRVMEKGSLECASSEMDRNGITYFVSLNKHPNTTFEGTLAASTLEPRIIPFTSIDYGIDPWEIRDMLEADIARGAKGLYIHPQLQGIRFANAKSRAAIEVFDRAGFPVVLHFGKNDCYYREDSGHIQKTYGEYGSVSFIEDIVSKYPECKFVLVHSAMNTGKELDSLMDCAKSNNWENVFISTSYKSAETIKKLVDCFGADRILFGSDFPFCDVSYALEECEKAFEGDEESLEKVLFKNAVALTHLYE